MTTKKDVQKRIKALEPKKSDIYSGPPYVLDVMAEIEADAKRLREADDPDVEYAKMLMESSTARGGELSFEEALKIAEETNEAVYTPWLSKEHTKPGGRRRDGYPIP